VNLPKIAIEVKATFEVASVSSFTGIAHEVLIWWILDNFDAVWL